MYPSTAGQVVPDISKDPSQRWDFLPCQNNTHPRRLESSANHCENLKSCKLETSYSSTSTMHIHYDGAVFSTRQNFRLVPSTFLEWNLSLGLSDVCLVNWHSTDKTHAHTYMVCCRELHECTLRWCSQSSQQ